MKGLIITGLSALVMASAIAPAATAEVAVITPMSQPAGATIGNASPFDVVNLAYQGFLANEGIPVAGGLVSEYRTGSVTAEDLVRAAISANRISSDRINDRGYVRAVNNRLLDLTNPGS